MWSSSSSICRGTAAWSCPVMSTSYQDNRRQYDEDVFFFFLHRYVLE